MLVLCSNGLSSEKLRAFLNPRFQNVKSAALVVTADPIYKEKNHHVVRCQNELSQFGLTTEIFDIDSQSAEQLLTYDVVEFIGGNPFYLLHSIRKHDAESILKKLVEKKILIGWSAAVFVFGPTLELVNRYSPEMNVCKLENLQALSLTDIEVLPHYSKFLKRISHFEEICREYEKEHCKQILRLNDGDGILIDGNDVISCYA
jgi:dipeptidase E